MNDTMHPADQRLLDAALRQLLRDASAPARTTTPRTVTPPRRPRRWLAAALMVLGVAVPLALALQARERRAATNGTPTQEPAPIPAEQQATDDTLADLPAGTTNLRFTIGDPRRLTDLARFRGLRRLVLAPAVGPRIAKFTDRQLYDWWSKVRPDLLLPLAHLEHLEELDFAFPVAVTAAVLQPLAGHPALHSLSLAGSRAPVDDAMVAALAAMPQLRALHLDYFPLDAAAMQRLAKLPLECLDLSSCEGFDDDSWQTLLSMRSLRELRLGNCGRKPPGAPVERAPYWRPDADQLRRLAALPQLTSLQLDGCDLRDDEVTALPDTLTELTLRGHELGAAGFPHLQRLRRLRKLDLDTHRHGRIIGDLFAPGDAVEVADAIAAALQDLSLERLDYWGELTPALVEAISRQRRLTQLRLTGRNVATLAGLETLPRLRTLFLAEDGAPGELTLAMLRPLVAAPALRELEVITAGIDGAAVKQIFGAHVTVITRGWITSRQR